MEFSDEHGSPVTYRIQYDNNPNNNPNDNCNNFCSVYCQQGNDHKVLRLHSQGENFTLNSLSNEFPTTAIQSATDCLRLCRTISPFRRLCLPSTHSLSWVEASEPTNSSNISLKTNEDDDALDELPYKDVAITNDDEDNLMFEISLKADNYRPCKVKAAHDAV